AGHSSAVLLFNDKSNTAHAFCAFPERVPPPGGHNPPPYCEYTHRRSLIGVSVCPCACCSTGCDPPVIAPLVDELDTIRWSFRMCNSALTSPPSVSVCPARASSTTSAISRSVSVIGQPLLTVLS